MAAAVELGTASQEPAADTGVGSRVSETERFELRCSACGDGVVVGMAPESCPMCRGRAWEHPPGPLRQVELRAVRGG